MADKAVTDKLAEKKGSKVLIFGDFGVLQVTATDLVKKPDPANAKKKIDALHLDVSGFQPGAYVEIDRIKAVF